MFNKIVLIAVTAAVTNALDSSKMTQAPQIKAPTTAAPVKIQWKLCGAEGAKAKRAGDCNCNGRMKYGAKGKFNYKNSKGWTACNNKTFGGDPIPGSKKSCFCQSTVAYAARRNNFNGKPTAWKCYPGMNGCPMRRNAAGEIECMSNDSKHCMWGGKCAPKLKLNTGKGVACGVQHSRMYNITGYGINHWCTTLNKLIPSQREAAKSARLAAQAAAKAKKATYANQSFLDSMGAFKAAEKRRQQWQAKQMALVAERFKRIGIYFSYVKKEIAAAKLAKRWNRIWMSAVKAHDAAIKAHKFSWNAMKAALAKSNAADKHHKLTVAALLKAAKDRSAALIAWGHAKDVFAAAEKAVKNAQKVFEAAHVVRTKAQKIADAANVARLAAIKAHGKASKAAQAASAKQLAAGRARSSALVKKNAANRAHGKVVSAKSDARARAVAANANLKKHILTMGKYAL